MCIPGANQTPEAATCKTTVIFSADHTVWDITSDFSSLTPGVTFRLYPRLYFWIAQVHLDCAVILSQASVPIVPALVTHRNTTRRWRIHLHRHPAKPCANLSPGKAAPFAGDVPALAACCWKSAGGSRKCQLGRAGGSNKVKINPNLPHQKIFSIKQYFWSCSVL